MKYALLLLFCLTFPACLTARLPATYVPPEQAAWFKLPYELPKEGQQTLSGTMTAAIQLAMDDFRPRHIPPPGDATPREICLHQRQVYDVEASPMSEQVILVRITVSPGACKFGRALSHDMGATYAVDTRNWRIRFSSPPASPRSAPSPIPHAPPEEAAQVVFPLALPEQGRQRLEGNTAAAIQLALEDFLPSGTPPPAVPYREACLDRRESYDVTAAPAREQGVVLVRFAVNLAVCDPRESIVDVTTYAVDVRTLRILAMGVHSLPRSPPGAPSTPPGAQPDSQPAAPWAPPS